MYFVVILVSLVEINGVLHIHILAWLAGPWIFHSPTEVICKYTVLPPNLW